MPLNGTSGPNTLYARFDRDAVYGLGGHDVLSSAGFNDTNLGGGSGNDRLSSWFDLSQVPDVETVRLIATQSGGTGNDKLSASIYGESEGQSTYYINARLNLVGGNGLDNISVNLSAALGLVATISIWGGIGDDVVVLNESDPLWESLSTSKHIVRAGEGHDRITIRTAGGFYEVHNIVQGEGGRDTITAHAIAQEWGGASGGVARNEISGGDGDDLIRATAHAVTEQGYAVQGNNVVSGDAGNDTINAESWGDNQLSGGTGNDVLRGTVIKDNVGTTDVNNVLDGGDGDDFLLATIDMETWSNEWVDDYLITNRLIGGAGNDILRATAFIDTFSSEGSARNVLLAGDGNDTLTATIQSDTVGANRLYGHSGNDRLEVHGGDGNLLHAGPGRDVMIGGTGGDTFSGAGGVDTFVFASTAGGADVITDFGRDDRIAIVGLVDRGARGLLNDLIAAVDTVRQTSAGGAVSVRFDNGATMEFKATGVGGRIDSIDDFIAANQIVDAGLFV